MPKASRALAEHPKLLRFGFLCLIGCALVNGLAVWSLRSSIFEGYGDFASFYTAGYIVRVGQSAHLYNPGLQWQVQQQFARNVKTRVGPLPYIRPPFEALLFAPFSYFSYPTACLLWLALKIIGLLVLPFMLPLGGRAGGRAWKALFCLAFFPVGFDLVQGQDSIVLLIIVTAAFRFLIRGANFSSGAILALGLFKFHIIIPLFLILLFLKRTRFALGFLVTGGILLLLSLSMVHTAGFLEYPTYLWRLNQAPGLGMVKPESMPNIRGVLSVLPGNESGAFRSGEHWFLLLVVVLGIAVAGWYCHANGNRSMPLAFSFSIVMVLVTSYYANSYDLTLILLPLLLLGGQVLHSGIRRWARNLFIGTNAVLLFTPVMWFLVLRVKQFSWMAFVVTLLAVSIWAIGKDWQDDAGVVSSR